MTTKSIVTDWDTTAANNTAAAGVPIDQAVSTADQLDDLFQTLMAQFAKFYDDLGGVNTVGGTATAVTVTAAQAWTAYGSSDGQIGNGTLLVVKMGAAATGAATLNVNTIGTKKIRRQGDSAIQTNDWVANGVYILRYDTAYDSAAGAWVLTNPTPNTATSTLPTGYLFGATISNNASSATTKIDVATGSCRDSTDADNLVIPAITAKDLTVTWAVGSSAGFLDSGTVGNNTYHIYAIKRPDTAVVDVIASLSASSPTLPSNYTLYRRIGSIVRTGGAIKAFTQIGDLFRWATRTSDVATTNPGTSAVTATLTVPTGIVVNAIMIGGYIGSANGSPYYLLVTALNETDTTPSSSAFSVGSNVGTGVTGTFASELTVPTNTSAQVRYRTSTSTASITVEIQTEGWIDTRNRL